MLYKNGARNFMFIDVPPIQYSPASKSSWSRIHWLHWTLSTVPESFATDPTIVKTYTNWKINLSRAVHDFCGRYPEASVFLYSSWQLFEKVLTGPENYGFSKQDVKKRGGKLWMDHLHPTSAFHLILADDIELFLNNLPPSEADATICDL